MFEKSIKLKMQLIASTYGQGFKMEISVPL